MLQCNTKILHATCNLNVVCDLHSKYSQSFSAGKTSLGCRFPRGMHICGKVPSSLKQLGASSFPIFYLNMEAQRLCNLSEGVWQSGNLNLDLCNPSWVSQGMIVLVKCYSWFLQLSISGARLAYQKASYLIFIFSLHNLSLLLKAVVRNWVLSDHKYKKQKRGRCGNTCYLYCNSELSRFLFYCWALCGQSSTETQLLVLN